MSMAHLIDDGNGNMIPDPDPNKLVTVQQLRNRIKGKYTQYDVIGGAEKFCWDIGRAVSDNEGAWNKIRC